MPVAATGNRILLGLLQEVPITAGSGPSYGYNVGAPRPLIASDTPPDAPSPATGSSGNVTGTPVYVAAYGYPDNSEGAQSDSATSSAVSDKIVNVTVDMTNGPDADKIFLYRDDGNGLGYGWVGAIYHNRAEAIVHSVGTGLSDITPDYAAYTGANLDAVFQIQITSAGTPDVFKWRKSTDGGVTWGSYTTGVNVTGSAQTLSNGFAVTFGATTGHTLNDVWTITVWSTVIADNCTTPDYTKTPSTASSRGANYGFRGIYVDNPTLYPTYKQASSSELRGQQGPARYYPSEVDLNYQNKNDLRPGYNVPHAAMQLGKYNSLTEVDNEATNIYVFKPSTGYDLPVSFSGLFWEGSRDLYPELLWNLMVDERHFKIETKKVAEYNVKVLGTRRTQFGIGTAGVTTGDYWDTDTPVLSGPNGFTSEKIDGKITTAPASYSTSANLGRFGVKACHHSHGTFDGPEVFFYYDLTTKKQVRPPAWTSAWPELLDENGFSFGADVGENREPVTCYFPGDVTTLDADDLFSFDTFVPIPGTGSSPYSGSPLRQEREFRITGAHCTIKQGATVAASVIDLISADLKIARALKPFSELGPEAKYPVDIDRTAVLSWALTLTRRYDSRFFQSTIERDDRLVLNLGLVGPRIVNRPALTSGDVTGLSAHRRGIVWDVPQATVLTTPKRVPAGRDVIHETLELMAEQPDDETKELFIETITTDRKWRLAA